MINSSVCNFLCPDAFLPGQVILFNTLSAGFHPESAKSIN
jgi:hypothetical protein